MNSRNPRIRELISEMDAISLRQVLICQQIIGLLTNQPSQREDLDYLDRVATRMRAETSAFTVNAAMINLELEQATSMRQLFATRRPALRIVQ